MTFRLDTSGSQLFTVSKGLAQTDAIPASLLDPKVVFHADFKGTKILKFQHANVRTSGSLYPNPANAGCTYYGSFDVLFGKTFTQPPFVYVCGYCNFRNLWFAEGYYYYCWDRQGSNNGHTYGLNWTWRGQSWGFPIGTPGMLDGITITWYDFDGVVNIYVTDGT